MPRPSILRQHHGLRSIIANGSWQSAMVGYNFVIRLAYVLAVSMMLGAEEYGFFAYAQTYYLTFLPLVMLGIDIILPREIGKHGVDAKELLHRTFSLRFSLGVLFALFAIIIGLFSEQESNHQLLIALISLTLVARGFRGWCGSVLLGFERSRVQMKFNSIFRTAEVAAGIIALLVFEAGLLELVLIHLLSWAGYAFICCLYIHRHLVPLRFRLRLVDFRDIIGENIGLTVQMFLGSLMINSVLIIYRHTSDDAEFFGQFALAFQAIRIVADMFIAFNSAAAPILARSHKREDNKDVRYAFGVSLLFAFLGALMLAVLWFVGEPVVLSVMGEGYASAAKMLGFMAIWLPFYIAKQPLYLFMRTRGMVWSVVCEQLLHLVIFACLLLWMGVSSYEPMVKAFAIASGVSYLYLLCRWRFCVR